ncbi:hypothetical protein HDV64DRAFT_249319 [Trichoderma sp. TUCIM 5745]
MMLAMILVRCVLFIQSSLQGLEDYLYSRQEISSPLLLFGILYCIFIKHCIINESIHTILELRQAQGAMNDRRRLSRINLSLGD